MNTSVLTRCLLGYAGFLMLIAVAAVSYVPEAGTLGFNAKAKTALLSGALSAGISLLWAWLLRRGHSWAVWAAITTTAIFFAAFTWRASAGWQAVIDGATTKAYAATLISLMWCASLATLAVLGTQVLRVRTTPRAE
jgi:uncharacterized membrane protein (UPF0136 family)